MAPGGPGVVPMPDAAAVPCDGWESPPPARDQTPCSEAMHRCGDTGATTVV